MYVRGVGGKVYYVRLMTVRSRGEREGEGEEEVVRPLGDARQRVGEGEAARELPQNSCGAPHPACEMRPPHPYCRDDSARCQ